MSGSLYSAWARWVAAAGLWRAVRDADGTAVDLELLDAPVGLAAWVGAAQSEIVGQRYSHLLPSGIHERLPTYLRALETGEPAALVFERWQPDGRLQAWQTRAVPVSTDELFLVNWDVTESRQALEDERQAHARTRRSMDLLTGALDATSTAVVVLQVDRDAQGAPARFSFALANRAALDPLGRAHADVTGLLLRDVMSPDNADRLRSHLVWALGRGAAVRSVLTFRSKTGEPADFLVSVTPVGLEYVLVSWTRPPAGSDGADPGPAAATGPVDGPDPLTGLLSRAEFRQRLARWIADPDQRERSAIVMFDLDRFGTINDLVGTHRSDRVLEAIGRELRAADSWLTLGARLAGDTFAAVLRPGRLHSVPQETRARLVQLVARAAASVDVRPIPISIGIRAATPDTDADALVRDCDTALRAAKRSGGDCFVVFSRQVRRSLVADFLDDADIREAIAAQQFHLAYQPIVRVETQERSGEEALLRWVHPEHGLIPPDRFIPLAESTGAISALGDWVIDRVLDRLAASAGSAQVGLNVSVVQLLRTHVPSRVAAALERTRVDPGRVVVEITESTFMAQSPQIREQLSELHRMGVGIAVDDFGSGFSSISYLDWIPVDVVKLDQAFLAGELTDRRRALLASTAALIRAVGAHSLAEGIETEAQLEAVRAAGIDLGQGYLFGRPELAA